MLKNQAAQVFLQLELPDFYCFLPKETVLICISFQNDIGKISLFQLAKHLASAEAHRDFSHKGYEPPYRAKTCRPCFGHWRGAYAPVCCSRSSSGGWAQRFSKDQTSRLPSVSPIFLPFGIVSFFILPQGIRKINRKQKVLWILFRHPKAVTRYEKTALFCTEGGFCYF